MRKFLTIAAVFMFIFSITDFVITGYRRAEIPHAEGLQSAYAQTESVQSAVYNTNNEAVFSSSVKEKFVAHRGYSGAAPENTVYAFDLAGRNGFWGIETDIVETADGQFVCIHDETVDRTTDGTGNVADKTYAELLAYDIDAGTNADRYRGLKIPSFEEYLSICAQYGCVAVAEIKKISNYQGFLQQIYDAGMENRCILTGGYKDLLELRKLNRTIPVMVIGYSNKPYTFYTDLMKLFDSNKGILYNYPVLDQNAINDVHNQGLYCGVWSLDIETDARKFFDYGVDFVVTNEIPGLNLMINTNE